MGVLSARALKAECIMGPDSEPATSTFGILMTAPSYFCVLFQDLQKLVSLHA